MHAISAANEDGNVLSGDVIAIDSNDTYVRSEDRLVAVVGLSDVIVVDTPDAVLVTERGKCQDVKKVVETLKAETRREAIRHTVREHQWGQSKHILTSSEHEMTLLRINPSASISIDPLPGRQIISGRAGLAIFDGLSRRTLEKGERVLMDVMDETRLTNTTMETLDVILVTLTSSISSEVEMLSVSNA